MTILAPMDDDGEELRDAALNLLRVHRARLIRECTIAALRIVIERGEVVADDVRALVAIPAEINPKLVGAAFKELAAGGILRRDGFRTSTRPAAHARPLSLWKLADSTAAAARLAELRTAID